jgi:hypothetical protein
VSARPANYAQSHDKANYHGQEAVARHRSKGTVFAMPAQDGSDTLTMAAVDLTQVLTHLPGLKQRGVLTDASGYRVAMIRSRLPKGNTGYFHSSTDAERISGWR